MRKLLLVFLVFFASCVGPATYDKTTPLYAATIQLTGWETGDSNEASSTSGTFSVQATTKRTGGYALQTNPTTTAVGWHRFAAPETTGVNGDGTPGGNNFWVRVYFRYATKPAATDEPIMYFFQTTGSTLKAEVRINSDGTLSAYDSTAALAGTSSTALAADTWYRLEVFCDTSAAAGDVDVKINGVLEIDSSSMNTTATAHGRVTIGKVANLNGNTVDFFWDDMLISSSDYPGAGEIQVMQPNANGSTQQWTAGTGASDYQEIDEIPPSTADYVTSASGAGDVGLFDLESSSSAGISGTITSVKGVIRTREDSAVTSATSIRLFSNATSSDSSGFNGSTTTVTQNRILDTDPDTSAAWTTGGLDALEVGAVEANAVAVRMSSALVMVDYVPAAGTRRVILVQ